MAEGSIAGEEGRVRPLVDKTGNLFILSIDEYYLVSTTIFMVLSNFNLTRRQFITGLKHPLT